MCPLVVAVDYSGVMSLAGFGLLTYVKCAGHILVENYGSAYLLSIPSTITTPDRRFYDG